MTAICAEAGLTERYFYESFAHRDDALLAALDPSARRSPRRAPGHARGEPGTPEERVHGDDGLVRGLGRPRARPRPGRRRPRERHPHVCARAATSCSAPSPTSSPSRRPRLYGEDAWPPDRARLQGLVYIAGFAELVAAWLSGEVDLTADELATTASDLFLALSRRR